MDTRTLRSVAKPVSELLAGNLRAMRRERAADLGSQPKIASKAKVGQRTVGRALKGEVSTTIGSIERLARAFGLDAWQLLHPDLSVARGINRGPLTAQQPQAIYGIDKSSLDDLLETFDKLTKAQRREFLQQMKAAVAANIEAARHMQGRIKVLAEDHSVDTIPPTPPHRNHEGT